MELPKLLVMKNHFSLDTLVTLCSMFLEESTNLSDSLDWKQRSQKWDPFWSNESKFDILLKFLHNTGESIYTGIHLRDRKPVELHMMVQAEELFAKKYRQQMDAFDYCLSYLIFARCNLTDINYLLDVVAFVKKSAPESNAA